ncbi:hypothetical protein ADUPG1_011660, partial [Aduncisulcus paluster]
MDITVKIPRLSTVTKEGWKPFRDEYRRYKRCHPTASIFAFLTAVQKRILFARIPLDSAPLPNDGTFIKAIDKLFAIGSELDCIYELEKLSLRSVTDAAITEYVEKFIEVMDATALDNIPDDVLLRKKFLSGIKLAPFKTRMEVALPEEPSLDECIRVTYEEAIVVRDVLLEAEKYGKTQCARSQSHNSNSTGP